MQTFAGGKTKIDQGKRTSSICGLGLPRAYLLLCGYDIVTRFLKVIGTILLIVLVFFAAWMIRTHMDKGIEKAMLVQQELKKEFTYLSIMPSAV